MNCFLFLWAVFALLDPDLDPKCESGSGYRSRDPIESGSTTLVLDPQKKKNIIKKFHVVMISMVSLEYL
jgi:hypothetical protein